MAPENMLEGLIPETRRKDSVDSVRTGPEREPEVWDVRIPAFNPHLAHTPEPFPVTVSPSFAAQRFNVEDYLAEERSKDLLRFSTAGSVDDGKSTLIGRLLYDTQSVYDDQLRSIEGKGTTAPGVLDLALLTDGLRAEREQGITIDVAYRYFSTAHRKFIIADTPGHVQYTRNMATGASTADVAVILIDARKGVLMQSRRHAYITALLGVQNVIVAINKMDLVEYSPTVFAEITSAFSAFFRQLDVEGVNRIGLNFVPVSALTGDNVARRSTAMAWYAGPTLLELLESLPSSQLQSAAPFRLSVQRVVRPEHAFRGFAGQIASGTVRRGDTITVSPSGRQTRVKALVTFDGDLNEASAPASITLTLEDEIDISRGDLLSGSSDLPQTMNAFRASLVWMDATPLELSRRYLLKQMSRTVYAVVRSVNSVFDLSEGTDALSRNGARVTLNEIARVSAEVLQPIAADPYVQNRHTGSFVLIDPASNLTVAAGMIESSEEGNRANPFGAAPVSQGERELRYGHVGARLILKASEEVFVALERTLFESGALVISGADDATATAALIKAGALVLSFERGTPASLEVSTGATSQLIEIHDGEVVQVTSELISALRNCGVLLPGGRV